MDQILDFFKLLRTMYKYRTITFMFFLVLFITSFVVFNLELYDELLISCLKNKFLMNSIPLTKCSITILVFIVGMLSFISLLIPFCKKGLPLSKNLYLIRKLYKLYDEGIKLTGLECNVELENNINCYKSNIEKDDFILQRYPDLLFIGEVFLKRTSVKEQLQVIVDRIGTNIREFKEKNSN